jgi:RNA polymerase sigma-70 factor (ECF subfamily)
VTERADSILGIAASTRDGVERTSPLEKEVSHLFDQWRNPLLGYVVTFGLPVHEGEEIVQETFLSLFQHLRLGKSRENLRSWIFRVGHNLALKRRYPPERELLEQKEHSTLDLVADTALNPEQVLAAKQRQARLLAVIGALPVQDRCCLHLRAEGLRYREIAEVLGISLGSVAFSLSRAIQRLRRLDI